MGGFDGYLRPKPPPDQGWTGQERGLRVDGGQ